MHGLNGLLKKKLQKGLQVKISIEPNEMGEMMDENGEKMEDMGHGSLGVVQSTEEENAETPAEHMVENESEEYMPEVGDYEAKALMEKDPKKLALSDRIKLEALKKKSKNKLGAKA